MSSGLKANSLLKRSLIVLIIFSFLSVELATGRDLMDDPALRSFVLKADNLKRVIEATRMMQVAAQQDPEFQKEFSTEETSETIDEVAHEIEAKRPRHVAVIRGVGLTTKVYLLTYLALLQADLALADPIDTAELKNSANSANLAFVQQHHDLVQAAMNEINKLNDIKERSLKGAPLRR